MVFPSLPVYHLDPPNWSQQQPNPQVGGVIPTQNPQVILPPPPQPSQPPPAAAEGGGGDATRPGSMADRARLAKIVQPEAVLKCPRCESTNTKFCYYNNYSLSQPRHFCKTCRRYWTRGGAMRNVPVGGGCRRKNKRSKGGSNTSKSATKAASSNAGSIVSNNSSTSCCPSDHHHLIAHLPSSQLLFSHNYSSYDVVSGGINNTNAEFQFQSGSSSMLSNGFTSSLQHQQFPFSANLEAPIGMYHQFERSENIVHEAEPSRSSTLLYSGGSGIVSTDHDHQLSTTVKLEENAQVLGMSKTLLGNSGNNNEQFWDANSGNAWNIDNNIPSFTSSSPTHLM